MTRFQYRLHPVDRIVGGMLLLPATADIIVRSIAAAAAAPEELTMIANVMPAPPMPFVPEAQHGKLGADACCATPAMRTPACARSRRSGRSPQPIADMVRPMQYPEMFPPEDPSYQPTAVARTMFITRSIGTSAETMIDICRGRTRRCAWRSCACSAARWRAFRRTRPPIAHRNSRIMVNVAAFYDGPADKPRARGVGHEICRRARPGDRAAYVNFLADEGEARVRAAYPGATWDRLAAIKARYDPDESVPAQPERPASHVIGRPLEPLEQSSAQARRALRRRISSAAAPDPRSTNVPGSGTGSGTGAATVAL